jgi:multiple sugar transport system ATP-binding protein
VPDIRLEKVSKVYAGGVKAVDEVSLTIRDGELVVLLGPSGCGKSTTLRMIAGLETITSGTLWIGERAMNDVDPKDRELAFVFQSYALFPHMTVAGNLGFGMGIRGVPRAEAERRLRDTAELLGLTPLLDRKPGQLSGGQRQRVALGRALLRDPVAFLLDEPLSNLDAKLRAGMRTELIKLHRRVGRTIVHVTHDQVEAMTMAERICIMKDGRIVQAGPPMEVYRNPADTFVAGFLATPPMNLLDARIETHGPGPMVVAHGVRVPLSVPLAGGPVILGLRPEEVALRPDERATVAFETIALAVEALGPEVILVGSLGDSDGPEVSWRMPRDFTAEVGQPVRLSLDPATIRLFELATGRAIPIAGQR